MTNTIQAFLQGQETSTVKDIATHGVQSGAIGELIYTKDIIDFYNEYQSNIEDVLLDTIENYSGKEYSSIENIDAMEQLNYLANNDVINFTTYDEMDTLLDEQAEKDVIAEIGADAFNALDGEEKEELIWEAKDMLDVLPTDSDMVNFVNLAVEIVAQEMTL